MSDLTCSSCGVRCGLVEHCPECGDPLCDECMRGHPCTDDLDDDFLSDGVLDASIEADPFVEADPFIEADDIFMD